MRLEDYLASTGESQRTFAKRAGLNQRTLCTLLERGGGCRVDTAIQIILATNGMVGLHDLKSPPKLREPKQEKPR